MIQRYKKFTKTKEAPGGFMERGEIKKKAHSKALDKAKKGMKSYRKITKRYKREMVSGEDYKEE